jgi:predicted TIM-barrel enzyme
VDLPGVAKDATQWMDVITTSGPATGQPASRTRIQEIRRAIGDHPLAIASGVDERNLDTLFDLVDIYLVSSSICASGDFYNFDPAAVRRLARAITG